VRKVYLARSEVYLARSEGMYLARSEGVYLAWGEYGTVHCDIERK
jgi:hypothetical protein